MGKTIEIREKDDDNWWVLAIVAAVVLFGAAALTDSKKPDAGAVNHWAKDALHPRFQNVVGSSSEFRWVPAKGCDWVDDGDKLNFAVTCK